MKKTFAIILTFVMLIGLVSCRTVSDDTSSLMSVDDVGEILSTEKTEQQENIQPQIPQTDNFISTIAKPDEVKFYKNGKYGSSKNSSKNYEIAKLVESWYKSYESDTLPFCNFEYKMEEPIAEIKQKETVVEICYEDFTQINMLSKIDHGKQKRIMIPLTGERAYYVYFGTDQYTYSILLGNLGGSGLEKYFDGITLDKDVRKWESTVIAPKKVTFYKDGMQSVSTDKEFNHKIARHIEAWFQYKDSIAVASLYATTDLINKNRRNETAIELQFDGEIKFYGGVINQKTRTLFIPLSGDDNNLIFHNSTDAPDDWTGPFAAGGGLEKFFDKVQFTPLAEENTKPAESVFDTENIIRITLYGYYGMGSGVDVPKEDMAELIKWLGTFAFGEKASDLSPPGTNTHIIEIEYANGTVINEGLDVIAVNGVSYKLNRGEFPDCYWELIAKSELPK